MLRNFITTYDRERTVIFSVKKMKVLLRCNDLRKGVVTMIIGYFSLVVPLLGYAKLIQSILIHPNELIIKSEVNYLPGMFYNNR